MRGRDYGWTVLLVAAAAMVGSLPGRTQGLGLVTEPLLADLAIDRVSYAALNFWATIIGSAGTPGIGRRVDHAHTRAGTECAVGRLPRDRRPLVRAADRYRDGGLQRRDQRWLHGGL